MNERLDNSFVYEHCDVPQGQSLAEWRASRQPSPRRWAQAATGVFAALSTFAPHLLRSRGTRAR